MHIITWAHMIMELRRFEDRGLIPRTVSLVFALTAQDPRGPADVRISFFEAPARARVGRAARLRQCRCQRSHATTAFGAGRSTSPQAC